jgi:photosystem II stability/assembly factor-like uncharacterized protein
MMKRILVLSFIILIAVITKVPACDWLLDNNRTITFCSSRNTAVATDEIWTLPASVPGVSRYNSDCHPSLTSDGRLMTYCSHKQNGPPYDPSHVGKGFNIYTARWNGTSWDSVRNAGKNVNPASYPTISPGGDTLFVLKGGKLWMSTWKDTGWSKMTKLPPPVNFPDMTVKDGPCAITRDGKELYFRSDRLAGYGSGDIWVVRITPVGYDSLTNLGPNVNTSDMETHPAISPDGERLYFSDFGGAKSFWKFGDSDVYISYRTETGWGPASILPAPVNTDLPACSAFESTDGRLYLGSEVSEGTAGEEDIWICYRNENKSDNKEDIHESSDMWENTGELSGAKLVFDLVEHNGILFAATAPDGNVFRSTNNGSTWLNTGEIQGESHVYSLLDAQDGSLLAGTYPNGKVFRTTNKGTSWNEVGNLPYARGVRRLFQQSNGWLYAGTSPDSNKFGRIWRSTDNGINWTLTGDVPQTSGGIFCFAEGNKGVLLTGGRTNGDNFYVSINNGNTWSLQNLPYADEHVTLSHLYFYYRTSDNRLWTGGWAHGPQGILLSSTNDGMKWDTCGVIPNGEMIVARVFDMVEDNDGSYFIGFHPGPDSVVFRSTDKGKMWHKAGTLSGANEALCFLKSSDGTIYAGTTPQGDVFKYIPSTGIETKNRFISDNFCLFQNYPNPFNPKTTIGYRIGIKGKVNIRIFDLLGNTVRRLVNKNQSAGFHSVDWNGKDNSDQNVCSGVYFYQITCGEFVQTRKLLLLK